MFIGHFALGLAAKRAAPRVPLVILFAAAQLADVLWPFFLAAGVEQVRIDPGNTAVTPLDFVSYPYSHSLVLLVVWGAVLAWVYGRLTGVTGAFAVIAALVVSHWVLDFVTHRPDMPIYPGSAKFGLGLWSSVPATIAVELPLFAAGVWIYAGATRARDGIGRWAFWSLMAFLVVAYFGNMFGPPPPSGPALWIFMILSSAILLSWTWWADAHRAPIAN
jgi:hypothetical protein